MNSLRVVAGAALLGFIPASAFADDDSASSPWEATSQTMQQEVITEKNLGSLSQIASTTVIDPHHVVWAENGTRLYIASAEEVFEFIPEEGQVQNHVSISPKETLLAISPHGVMAFMRDSETIILRDFNTQEELAVIALDFPVSSATFSPDGRMLAVVLDNGTLLQLRDARTGERTEEFRSPDQDVTSYSVEFAPSGEDLVWLSPTSGRALNLASGVFGPPIAFPASIVDAAVSPNGQLLVATGDDVLSRWDLGSGVLEDSVATTPALSLDYPSNGRMLLLTTESGVTVVEATSWETLHALQGQAIEAIFAPSDDALAIVGADGLVSVWAPR
jgi:WD40 repeat protein